MIIPITVTAANDAPTCADDGAGTANTPLNSSVSCTDVDGDGLTYAEVVGPSDGSLTLNPDGSAAPIPIRTPATPRTPSPLWRTIGTADSNVATFTITINPVNDAPTCSRQWWHHGQEDAAQRDAVHVHERRRRWPELRRGHRPLGRGRSSRQPGRPFTYDPDPDFNGTDSFTFVANDGTADSNTATFTIGVGVGNDAPVLDPIGNQTVPEGSTLTFTASASDIDVPPDTLTFSLAGAPGTASIDSITGEFTWTPLVDGPVTFDVCVDDGSVADCETITVTVLNVAPSVALTGPTSATVGETLSYAYIDRTIPAPTRSRSPELRGERDVGRHADALQLRLLLRQRTDDDGLGHGR